MRRRLATATLVVVAALAPLPAAADFLGYVVGIVDGDTLDVLVNGSDVVRVRVAAIDAPERGQPFGRAAKAEASDLAFGHPVRVVEAGHDRYGRVIGDVLIDGDEDLGAAMVAAGLAWRYVQYAPNDEALATLEEAARSARVGLWVDPAPMPPWAWRRH